MSVSAQIPTNQPMMEMNTTPLIDVLLVLLIMFIITIPASTHSVELALPGDSGAVAKPHPVKNRIVLTRGDVVLWNEQAIAPAQLPALLQATLAYPVEPELQFEPEPEASYNLSATVMAMIKASRVTKFGFVGNERYGQFTKSERPQAK